MIIPTNFDTIGIILKETTINFNTLFKILKIIGVYEAA